MKFPEYPGGRSNGWRTRRLKFLVDLRNEKVDAHDVDLDYMGLEHIESWTGRRLYDVEAQANGVASQFEAGDVLFGKLRPYLAKVHLAESRGVCSTEALVLEHGPDLRPRFLKYQLLCRSFIDAVTGASYGSKMPRASWDDIGNQALAFPSPAEQEHIANFLDWKTGQIEALSAKKQALLHRLDEARQTLIFNAVTRGLRAGAKLANAQERWIGMAPEHWPITRIKFLAQLESGHTPSRSVPEYWVDCTIPWVSLNDSQALRQRDSIRETHYCINELGLENSSARMLPAGAVVFSRDATVGLCAITEVPMAVSQHFVAYLCGPDLLPEYLLLALKAMGQHLQSLQTGSTISTIGMPEVRSLAVPQPPVAEQREIVAFIARKVAGLDRLVARSNDALRRLSEYRSALITAAVTGQIDVRGVTVPAPA